MNTNLLKAKMVLAGKTQKDLAVALSKTESSISAKFTGKSPLYIDEAEKICALLNINDPKEKRRNFFHNPIPKRDKRVS